MGIISERVSWSAVLLGLLAYPFLHLGFAWALSVIQHEAVGYAFWLTFVIPGYVAAYYSKNYPLTHAVILGGVIGLLWFALSLIFPEAVEFARVGPTQLID